MESAELLFKSLAVLHGVAGFLTFGISTHEGLQQPAFESRVRATFQASGRTSNVLWPGFAK
jgi:hypothetical protein